MKERYSSTMNTKFIFLFGILFISNTNINQAAKQRSLLSDAYRQIKPDFIFHAPDDVSSASDEVPLDTIECGDSILVGNRNPHPFHFKIIEHQGRAQYSKEQPLPDQQLILTEFANHTTEYASPVLTVEDKDIMTRELFEVASSKSGPSMNAILLISRQLDPQSKIPVGDWLVQAEITFTEDKAGKHPTGYELKRNTIRLVPGETGILPAVAVRNSITIQNAASFKPYLWTVRVFTENLYINGQLEAGKKLMNFNFGADNPGDTIISAMAWPRSDAKTIDIPQKMLQWQYYGLFKKSSLETFVRRVKFVGEAFNPFHDDSEDFVGGIDSAYATDDDSEDFVGGIDDAANIDDSGH